VAPLFARCVQVSILRSVSGHHSHVLRRTGLDALCGPGLRALRRPFRRGGSSRPTTSSRFLLDLGTGLRLFAPTFDGAIHGTALLSHLHWDHSGPAVLRAGSCAPTRRSDISGPQADGPLAKCSEDGMCRRSSPSGTPTFLGHSFSRHRPRTTSPSGLAKVRSAGCAMSAPTLGFRIEWNGTRSRTADHGPGTVVTDRDDYVPPAVLELSTASTC